MSNHQVILDNILPGDILLSRKQNGPISEVIDGVTRSKWSYSFLYIGNDKIIESHRNSVSIKPLQYYLNNQFSVGLFRSQPALTANQAKRLIKAARKMLNISYGCFHVLLRAMLRLVGKSEDPDWALSIDQGMTCSEIIAKSYSKAGIHLKDLPASQIKPVDLDESSFTVRIA